MLREIQHVLDNPEDIPAIPPASAQYLEVRLNAAYLIRSGVLDDLRKAGFSESYIAGFVEGCAAACEIVELMQEAQSQKED